VAAISSQAVLRPVHAPGDVSRTASPLFGSPLRGGLQAEPGGRRSRIPRRPPSPTPSSAGASLRKLAGAAAEGALHKTRPRFSPSPTEAGRGGSG
jgi:hypothetical protein